MKHPCGFPGCAALLDKSGYCPAHAKSAKQSGRDYDRARRAIVPHLAAAKALRSSREWQRIRRIKLTNDPLCEDPHGDHASAGRTATATQVHHILPLATNPHLGLDLSNLMSVCTRCHAKTEQVVRRTERDNPKPTNNPSPPTFFI